MRRLLLKDLLSGLDPKGYSGLQKSCEYVNWVQLNVADITSDFVEKNRFSESYFIKKMNTAFKTTRFEILLKRWMIEYLSKLLGILDDFAMRQSRLNKELDLEDNPLNRSAVEIYYSRFKIMPRIKWKRQPSLLRKIFNILLRCPLIFYLSLDKGLKICGKRKRYKIMREALWGLYDTGGYYFHDDFLVDGDMVKKEDILLYSRGIPTEKGRLKGYHDARKSPYIHFDLLSLSLGIGPLFSRVIPKYIISGSMALFKELSSCHFSLYWSIYLCFVHNALSHEKVFSHYEITAELGHNFFSASHIAEAIVCQNYSARYYLMHWSDISAGCTNKYALYFLGCDGFLTWGNAHIQGVERGLANSIPTGYLFKRFIREVKSDRYKILAEMSVFPRGKIVTFFDEIFGGDCPMTEENYVTFWETAFKVARKENSTVLVKPKYLYDYNNMNPDLKKRFIHIRDRMKDMSNVYIIDWNKWSFIEAIGVSDIVVSQGMTSSSTIAIVCGIEGLYLDQAEDDHAFTKIFRDKLVFDDPDKLLVMLNRIIEEKESPLGDIPGSILREYDAFDDDLGIDRFRQILLRQNIQERK